MIVGIHWERLMFTKLIGLAIGNRLFGVRSIVGQNQINVKCVILAV